MEWLSSLIAWLSENGKLFLEHPLVFIAFAVIEAAILLVILQRLYGDKLKELPNLSDIKDKLRRSQEDNLQLSTENQNLQTENETLRREIRALQSDQELLMGMESKPVVESIGAKISETLGNR